MLIFSGKCILFFFSFWGKEKKNHISSSNIYLAFIMQYDYAIKKYYLHFQIRFKLLQVANSQPATINP